MSFDVYVQCYRNGESSGIARDEIRSAFGEHLTQTDPDFWQLRYDEENSCDLDLTGDDADARLVRGFTVRRPCADPRLWDALASILSLGDLVLYFPGGRVPLVARSSVVQHLPPDMVEALGNPMVVASGKEIKDEIEKA